MKFRIDLKILIFLLIFYLTNQLDVYIIIMIFCLMHELGHLIVGIFLKFKPTEMEIMPLGFFITLKQNTEDYNKKILKSNIIEVKKIFVLLAGPIVNLIMIYIFLNKDIMLINRDVGVYSNLIIFLFNLIPIYPLDGARILNSIIKLLCGNKKANKYIYQISNFSVILLTMISSIAIFYLKNISILFILIYLWYLTYSENKKNKIKEKIYESIS